MRLLWAVSVLALALLAKAQAGEQTIDAGESGVGQGIICNTPDQAGRLLALRNDGKDAASAVEIVNTEVRDPRACGTALIAFTASEELGKDERLDGKPVSIMKITVIAISDGARWAPIAPKVQYTVVPAKGIEI